jgi:hypothetical protein
MICHRTRIKQELKASEAQLPAAATCMISEQDISGTKSAIARALSILRPERKRQVGAKIDFA